MIDTLNILGMAALIFLGLLTAGILELGLALTVGRLLAGPERGRRRRRTARVYDRTIEPTIEPETGAERLPSWLATITPLHRRTSEH